MKIHIVTEDPALLEKNYVAARLSAHWQAWGHVITTGQVHTLEADVGIMHIDRTRVAAECLPTVSASGILLNQQVLDISKQLFSALRVFPHSLWDGPVIIKSNLNCFGEPERKLHAAGFIERKRRKLARKSWQLARMLPVGEYPVLPTLAAVPGWVWQRDDIIVERFMPEKSGDLYSIRGWLFFGRRGYAYRLFSRNPVVKSSNIERYEILDAVPAELEIFRQSYGFDFGKLDYVEIDGRVVVIDMNKTPTTIAPPDSPRLLDLAQGIYDFSVTGR